LLTIYKNILLAKLLLPQHCGENPTGT